MAAAGEVVPTCSEDKLSEMPGQDESSESEGETEPTKSFHRRISTNKELKTTVGGVFCDVSSRISGWAIGRGLATLCSRGRAQEAREGGRAACDVHFLEAALLYSLHLTTTLLYSAAVRRLEVH